MSGTGVKDSSRPAKYAKKKSYNFRVPDEVSASRKTQKRTGGLKLDIDSMLGVETGADFLEDLVIY